MKSSRSVNPWTVLFVIFLAHFAALQSSATTGTDPNIAAAATKLNGITSQAIPQQSILVGTYDGASNVFSSGLPTQYLSGLPGYKQSNQGGPAQPFHIADINSYNVTYQVQLRNAPTNIRLSLVPAAQQDAAGIPATFNSNKTLASISFHPSSGAIQLLWVYVDNIPKNGLEIAPVLRPQLGAFVVPYLLLAIVYEPPGSQSSASYSTTSTVGTMFSWDFVRSSGLSQTTDTATFLDTIGQIASGAGAVLPGPYGTAATGFGTAVSVINQLQPNTQSTFSTSESTTQSGSTSWTVVQTSSYNTGAHQYPGQGDVFVVMKDVLFAYATVNNRVILAPVKYSVILLDTISQLQADMPANEVAKYQSLDLMLNPNSASVATRPNSTSPQVRPAIFSPRLSSLGAWECPTEASQQYSIAREQLSSAGLSRSTTQTWMTQVTGMIASILGGDGTQSTSITYASSAQTRQGQGQAALITLSCPEFKPADNVMVDLYFDNLFGTFLSRLEPSSIASSSSASNPRAVQAAPAAARPEVQAPAANITSINTQSNLVTARVNATGQQFQFTLSNSAQLRTLRVGQPIYVNFTKRQISLDGQRAAGIIVRIGPSQVAPADAPRGTVTRPRFTVSQIAGGYGFYNVSLTLMSVLPNGAKLEVTLDHPTRGKSTVIGTVTKTASGFQIKTPQRLNLDARGAWLLVRSARQGGTFGQSNCSGCPRDPQMTLDPNETSCWCLDSSTPTVLLGRPDGTVPPTTGCGSISAK